MALYCLKPTSSLRNQLLLSFGTATAVVGVIFLITAVVCYQLSGKVITQNADSLFRKQILSNLRKIIDMLPKNLENLLNKRKEFTVWLVKLYKIELSVIHSIGKMINSFRFKIWILEGICIR